MKNLIIYYFVTLIPVPILVWSVGQDAKMFVVLLIAYYFFRSFVDGKRLIDKGVMSKHDFGKAFIPFYTSMFFKELYFEK